MTFENSKRLYIHYLSVGRTADAEELAAKYPELRPKPKGKPTTEDKK